MILNKLRIIYFLRKNKQFFMICTVISQKFYRIISCHLSHVKFVCVFSPCDLHGKLKTL
jgi:hypothetical protein